MVNAHDVLNVIQHMLVLLDNANELISQTRRCYILQYIDKSLEKYGKEPAPSSRDTLFGDNFCSRLKWKVESDTMLAQVVSMSKRYHPYMMDNEHHQSTWGEVANSFFKTALPGRSDPAKAANAIS